MLWQHHARIASSTLPASQTSSAHGIHCMQVRNSSRSLMPAFAVCFLAQQQLLLHYRATQLRLLLTHCMLAGTHSSRRSSVHAALSATVHRPCCVHRPQGQARRVAGPLTPGQPPQPEGRSSSTLTLHSNAPPAAQSSSGRSSSTAPPTAAAAAGWRAAAQRLG